MSTMRNEQRALFVAVVVLMLAALGCSLPGLTVSPPSPPEEASPTTPPSVPTMAPTDTPVVVEPTATPAQPPVTGVLKQWAVGAVASSEYSSPEWSAQQATGVPDTPYCGDVETAWASGTSDGVDWLEVSYATAVIPTGVNIYENHSPGFINRVEVRDDRGLYHTVWEGTPGEVEECPRVFSVAVSGVDVSVNAVRISLDQSDGGYYDEIDAVELVGQP